MSRRTFFGSRSSRPTKVRRPERFRVEQLETRQLMAADLDVVNAFVQNGTLYIHGSQQADVIQVKFSVDRIQIPGFQITNSAGQLVDSVTREEVPYQVIATGQAGDDLMEVIEDGVKALPVIFYGNAGNDTLIGGSNEDWLIGQDGIDTLIGGAGNDNLNAALWLDERDPIQTGPDQERLEGGEGNDVLNGSPGSDLMYGGPGGDTLRGFGGDDRLDGGDGQDVYEGGAGYDTLVERGLANATLTDHGLSYGGADWGVGLMVEGIERAKLFADPNANTGVTYDASQFSGKVSLVGTEHADVLIGGQGDDALMGMGGDDELIAGGGDNYLDGGQGNDILRGGMGNDEIYGREGDDQINSGWGMANMVDGGDGRDRLLGSVGGGTATLTDAVFEEIGMSSTRLSNVEEALFTNWTATSRHDLLIRAGRGIYRPLGRGVMADVRADNSGWTSPIRTTSVNATGFSGTVNVFDPSGFNMTHEMIQLGQLRVARNPNILNFLTPTESALLGQLEKDVRQGLANGLWGDVGPQVASGVKDGVAYVRFAEVAFYRWGSNRGEGAILAGPMLAKYVEYFAEDGALGMPTRGIQGFSVFGGTRQIAAITFENGVLATSSTRPDEWEAVWGNPYRQFLANGGFEHLGAPVSPNYRFEGGEAARFERGVVICMDKNPTAFHPAVLNFESNLIVHHLDGSVTTSEIVDFFGHWEAMGGMNGPLHAPVGKAERVSIGNGEFGYMQKFQDGALYWAPGRPVTSTQGLIHKMYMDQGGPAGRFGLPLGDEYFTENRNFASNFQYGYIRFQPDESGWKEREFYLKLNRTNEFWVVDEDDFAG